MRLTAAGAALLRAGREVLAAADAAFADAQAAGQGLAGTVNVGVSPAVGPADRAAVTRALRDGAPQASVSLHELRPAEIVTLLRDRSVDLVLARTRRPAAPEIDSAALRPSPAELLVPAGHRLAGADGPVPWPNSTANGC